MSAGVRAAAAREGALPRLRQAPFGPPAATDFQTGDRCHETLSAGERALDPRGPVCSLSLHTIIYTPAYTPHAHSYTA